MKPIFAIDPGTRESAYVEYDPTKTLSPILSWGHVDNAKLLLELASPLPRTGVIEVMQSYMLRVGESVFLTCEWIGRFDHQWRQVHASRSLGRLTKPEVSLHLCGRRNATKPDLNGALYQKFGGSRRAAVGVKKEPGPLYGLVGDHIWDALALAVTWHEQNQGALCQANATGRDPDRKPGHHRSPMAAQ
jgi:hypothetical protein